MKGIEKMTALILDEAKAAADAVLAEAEREAETILSDYQSRADSDRAAETAGADLEAAQRIERAEASAQQIRRNTLLAAKSALLDAAFGSALDRLVNLPDGERLALYTAIFGNAVQDQLAAEKTAAANDVYGEYTVPDTYTLLLSQRDLAAVGEKFHAAASDKLKSAGKTLILSERTVPIAGGFVLVCGDVELSCTLSGYMEQIRSQIEGEVCQILFA